MQAFQFWLHMYVKTWSTHFKLQSGSYSVIDNKKEKRAIAVMYVSLYVTVYCEIIILCKCLCTLMKHIGLLSCVVKFMLSKLTYPTKCFSTLIANKGLLTVMNETKCLATLITFLGLLTCMESDVFVPCEVNCLIKYLPTLITHIGLLIWMGAFVYCDMKCLTKCLSKLITLIRLLTCMGAHVFS